MENPQVFAGGMQKVLLLECQIHVVRIQDLLFLVTVAFLMATATCLAALKLHSHSLLPVHGWAT